MRQKGIKILFIFILFMLGCLPGKMTAYAKVHDIILCDEDGFADWDSSDDEEFVDEEDLYLPGDSGKITIGDNYLGADKPAKVEYISTNPAVVSVDQEGNYQVLNTGTAIVTIKCWDEYDMLIFQDTASFVAGGDVSQTTLEKANVNVYFFDQDYDNEDPEEIVFPLVNVPDLTYSSFEVESVSDPDRWLKCRFDKERKALIVETVRAGKVTIAFRLNKKKFTAQLTVADVTLKKTSALLVTKGKLQLKIKGYPGKVKWVSTNKKAAVVTNSGLVKAKKKTGNTLVYAQIGNHRLGCAVSVVSPKMKKVINYGKKIAKTCKYSQAKRMNDKYYDCSSLVWKSYRKAGKYVGSRTYAPVAADLAKWCKKKKKMVKGGVSNANLTKMKLKPGDLVFLTGSNNGRYKGIYHVEMFSGYVCYGFRGGKPIIGPCWVNRASGYATGAQLVGRP